MKLAVAGAGKHSDMVQSCLREAGHEIIAIFDDDPQKLQGRMPNIIYDDIANGLRALWASTGSIIDGVYLGIGSIDATGNRTRQRIFDQIRDHGFVPHIIKHNTAIVARDAYVPQMGVQIMPGAIINPFVALKNNVLINTGAIIEHNCTIGPHAHVAPGAILCGNVQVGMGAFIGAGATVIQGIKIGDWATVAAGATVIDDVSEQAVVYGTPARTRAALMLTNI